ncbi:MAG: class I SAM-dependent methyltransferase [Lentisphaeria bacterium]
MINKNIEIFSWDWPDYELLDSGDRKRLERFGNYVVVREEPKAWWSPDWPQAQWNKAIALLPKEKEEKWQFKGNIQKEWLLEMRGIKALAKFTDMSKHLGVFPEQCAHWNWIIDQEPRVRKDSHKLLNLFGYTGMASLAASKAGFHVTHVDASKPVIAWGRKNQELSDMNDRQIRWILDDAMKFVKREIRRGAKYDAIILDPPSYGRGPNREVWKVEQMLPELLSDLRQILSDKPLFIILNMYSIDASALMVANMLQEMMKGKGGTIQPGELVINQTSSEKTLPMSIYARWSAE